MHLPEQSIILELMEMSRWAWCSAPTLYIPCLHHTANCPRIPLPNPSKPRCKIITPYALATSAKLKIQAGLWVPQHPRTGPWTDEMEETAKQPTTPPWAVAQIMSLHSIPARWFVQLFVAAVQLNEGATWLSSELQVIHWAAIATGEENKCSGMKRQKKQVCSQSKECSRQVLHCRTDGGKHKNNLFFSDTSSILIPWNPSCLPALQVPYQTCTWQTGELPPWPQHYFLIFPFLPVTAPRAAWPDDAKSHFKQKWLPLISITDW